MLAAPIFAAVIAVAGGGGVALACLFETAARSRLLGVSFLIGAAALAFSIAPPAVPFGAAIWSVLLISGLSALAIIDGLSRTVPDILSIPMILLGLLHAHFALDQFLPMAVAAFIIIGVGLVMAQVAPQALRDRVGGGDILLFAGAAAWFGPFLMMDILLLTGLCMAAHAAGRQITKAPSGFPLAPSLGLAQAIIWLGGPIL